jgi:hypothetical protein
MRRFVFLGILALVTTGVFDVGAASAQTLPPTIAVAPFTNLVHLQEVRVAGFGFAPDAGVVVGQCVAGIDDISACDGSTAQGFRTNQYGAFDRAIVVRRVIRTYSGDTVDCATAPGTCVMATTIPAVETTFPLAFDANGPLPAPTLTVTPDTSLLHKQQVIVSGSGFDPNAQIGLAQCRSGAGDYECSFGAGRMRTAADGNGAFSIPFVVSRSFFSGGSAVDCDVSVGACSIFAFNSMATADRASRAIGFDPTAPVATPTVTVDPDDDLVHRQIVTVAGSGFPASDIEIVECLSGTDPFTFPRACGPETYTVGSASGGLSVEVQTRRFITDTGGTQVDCADAAGTCEMIAASHEDPFAIGRVPLEFDPNALPPPPTMKIRPRKDLRGGQRIAVTGEGFSSFSSVGIVQCRNNATDGQDDCDLSTTTFTFTNAIGSFETTFVVRGRMQTANGPVNCKAAPKTCAVGGANVNDPQGEQAGAGRLTFRRITG